ncbi:MAG: helix-turn-helix transcriptional regulator [Defluviimonas sp.]|uniref:helix-turn-helix transcriptional regulator n=1 Tax=Albidovulum sp. TaxID=1872424 RepID=UPI001DADF60C|nr:helix-turn-helix transcriptional regulator [Paracoccaceae bacterium]MCC0064040.1 helix-turn-helix transcriptional regulator [Defluviimonas sp.]
MVKLLKAIPTEGLVIIALICLQAFASIFFVIDVLRDIAAESGIPADRPHLVYEVAANLGLFGALVFESAYLVRLLRRHADAQRTIAAATGALQAVMETYFEDWGLTPAEADIATFTIKGCSIAEVAEMRGSAEGTVKTHLNAIYRKSGLSGRSQLVSLLIEDLLDGVVPQAGAEPPRTR